LPLGQVGTVGQGMQRTAKAGAIRCAPEFSCWSERNPKELTRWWPLRCSLTPLLLCLGLAVLVCEVRAEDQTEHLEQSRAAEAGKSVQIPIWKRVTTGTYKSVNAICEALDAAGMHIGDSADEIVGRPTFPFSQTKTQFDRRGIYSDRG
jgi:hypothetical protein